MEDCYLNSILSRYIINAPWFTDPLDSDFEEVKFDLFIALEKAYYDYEDFYFPKHKKVGQVKMKQDKFSKYIIDKLYPQEFVEKFEKKFHDLVEDFEYKTPVAGMIVIDKTREKVLVVVSKKGSYGLPKGKVSGSEDYVNLLDCALNECLEETSLDVSGFVDTKRKLICQSGKDMYYYIALTDFDEKTHLEPLHRGEVGSYEWDKFDELKSKKFAKARGKEIYDFIKEYLGIQ